MKNFKLRFRNVISSILFITILLFPIPISISSYSKDTVESPKIPNPFLQYEELIEQYLFLYNEGEEKQLEDLFSDLFHKDPTFFQNLNIAMISLTQEESSLLQHQNRILSSRLHKSKQFQFLPSVDDLLPERISNIKQTIFETPSSVVNASASYENGFDGEGVKIAILDSGIDKFHPDFPSIWYEESFVTEENGYSSNESEMDLHGHGTHVAGIAAGSGESYPGVAYNAQLVNLKVADMFGGSTEAGLIAAINRSIEKGVDVVSIFLGFDISTPFGTEDILTRAVNSAVDQGITVVVAAGNEATEPVPYTTIGSPASASKVITVGASNGSENVVSFSSQGPSLNFRVDPDIVAPGYQIVGPLALGGVMDKAYNALVGISIQDYIVLSGTSMSAPVVSGAVALLKQQFPDASPHALRAALLESATDLGENESIYTQGSGLINVGKAGDLLSQSKTTSGYELISSLPRASEKPVEFFQPLVFPGDKTELRLSFMTGAGGTITWEVNESLDPFIEFDTTPTVLNSTDYFEKNILLEIPLNTPLGDYSGYIRYTAFGKSYDLIIEFSIQKPRGTVYWDSYHTGRSDSIFYNYRYLDEILQDPSFLYDINDHFTTISSEKLSHSDILVLTDLEHTMSEEEITIIKDFHENNGSIVLLTSFFPYYNPDVYNKLISLLNLPIDLTNQTSLIDYADNGRDRETNAPSLDNESFSWDDNSPFFKDVDNLPILDGTAFTGNFSDPTIVHYLKYSSEFLVAGIEPKNKGKILVLGSEKWFSTSFLSENTGQTFISSILTWLKPERPSTNLAVNFNTSSVEIALYSSQVKDYSFSLTFENGTTVSGYEIVYNSSLGFNYLNLTLNGSSLGNIKINFETSEFLKPLYLNFTNPSSFPSITDIEVIPRSTGEITEPSWANSNLKYLNEALEVKLNHTASSSVFAKLIVSSHTEKTLDVLVPPIDSIASHTNESVFLNLSNTQKSVKWEWVNDYPIGYYSYEIQVWWNSTFGFPSMIHSERGFVYVPDREPVLLTSESSVGGKSIDEHQEMTGTPIWDPDQDIEMIFHISDNTGMEEGQVHFQLLHYYLFAADRTILGSSEITHSSFSDEVFIGWFDVPDEPIPLPDEEEYKLNIDYEIFVLLFFIRDSQGNYIVESVFFTVYDSISFDLDLLFVIGAIFIVIIGAIIFFVRRSSRNRIDPYSYGYSITHPQAPVSTKVPSARTKFCIHCGEKVPWLASFCSHCGKHVDFNP